MRTLCEITNHGFGLFLIDQGTQNGADWMYRDGKYRILKPHRVHILKCFLCGLQELKEDGIPEFEDHPGYNSIYDAINARRR